MIKNNKLIYKENLHCSFAIQTGRVQGKEQRFFHVVISFSGEENDIDQYTEVLRAFRVIIKEAKGELETLNNDVSTFYANKSYPLIHKLENLMRKLITYFMITQVGKEWVTEASPKNVKDAINNSKRPQQYGDVLHKVDFIHLGAFLFKEYQTKDVSNLYKLFDSVTNSEELILADLRDYKAKSNWEKYFSRIVDCTRDYLKNRWDALYKLRCDVAHNAIITKSDYERTAQLVGEVSEKLENAINNIGDIQVPEEEKETLVENVVSNINALSGEFINYWKLFEIAVKKYAFDYDFIDETINTSSSVIHLTKPLRAILTAMINSKLIPKDIYEDAVKINDFRNNLIHGATFAFDEQDIILQINTLKKLLSFFEYPIDTSTWKTDVVEALKACGGEAHLIDIYAQIEKNVKRTLPETWKAAVRYTLQKYCSEVKAYGGGEDLFEHVDIGRWGLKS